MLEKQQAVELKKTGLTAYNHNLDTSREYYPNVITTRTYDERLETLEFVRDAGINVCSGNLVTLLNILRSDTLIVGVHCNQAKLMWLISSSKSKCK